MAEKRAWKSLRRHAARPAPRSARGQMGVEGVAHHLRPPVLGQVEVDHLAAGVDAGVGAAGGVQAHGLAAEGQHRRARSRPGPRAASPGPGSRRRGRRRIRWSADSAASVQPRAGARSESRAGSPRRPGPPRPSRWARRRRTAPSPQAISRPSSRATPGSPSASSARDSRALTRTGPRSDGATNQAPGDGERPRIWRSTSRRRPIPVDARLRRLDLLGVGRRPRRAGASNIASPRSSAARASDHQRRARPAARRSCRVPAVSRASMRRVAVRQHRAFVQAGGHPHHRRRRSPRRRP